MVNAQVTIMVISRFYSVLQNLVSKPRMHTPQFPQPPEDRYITMSRPVGPVLLQSVRPNMQSSLGASVLIKLYRPLQAPYKTARIKPSPDYEVWRPMVGAL